MQTAKYPVLITYTNFGYVNFAKEVVKNCFFLQFHKLHFYCLDEELLQVLKKYLQDLCTSYNTVENPITLEIFNASSSSDVLTYGSQKYNHLTHHKVDILKRSLDAYKFIHFIDCDVLCLNEPSDSFYEEYAQYDIVFQYDCGFNSTTDEPSGEIKPHHPRFNTWVCTGNMTLRDTDSTRIVLDGILQMQSKHTNKNDQECLQEYFHSFKITDITKFCFASLYVYPYEEFTNGWWLNNSIGDLSKTKFFHANRVVGYAAKMQLFQRAIENSHSIKNRLARFAHPDTTVRTPIPMHVINLARRQDRWTALTEHLQTYSSEISILRHEGSDAQKYPDLCYLSAREKGGLHCCISHKELLASLQGNSNIHLIAEDDLVLKDWGYIKECLQAFQESEFDICNLGFNPTWMPIFTPAGPSGSILREVESGKCLCTHLYAIKSSAIPKFIAAIEFTAAQLLSGKTVYTHTIDHCWTFPEFKIRLCVPSRIQTIQDMPAIQNNSQSDINI